MANLERSSDELVALEAAARPASPPPSAPEEPRIRRDLPTGTVTFLFTDVEGSTSLLNELGGVGTRAAARGIKRPNGVLLDAALLRVAIRDPACDSCAGRRAVDALQYDARAMTAPDPGRAFRAWLASISNKNG